MTGKETEGRNRKGAQVGSVEERWMLSLRRCTLSGITFPKSHRDGDSDSNKGVYLCGSCNL